MPLQDSIQQEVVSSIKEALRFNNLYQRIRPDTSLFITATSKLPLKKLDEWERLIRWEIYSALQMDERTLFVLCSHANIYLTIKLSLKNGVLHDV